MRPPLAEQIVPISVKQLIKHDDQIIPSPSRRSRKVMTLRRAP